MIPERARALQAERLRQLWERGERGRAIRGALQHWDLVRQRSEDSQWLERALRACGLPAEALACQIERTRRRSTDARAWESLVRTVFQSGDPWLARELLEDTGCGTRALQALQIDLELTLGGDASTRISKWLTDYNDEAALDLAVTSWVRSGRIEEAVRLAEHTDALALWRARFALWRRQPETARALLNGLPASPEVRCLLAVAAIQEGRFDQAEGLLKTLLDSDVAAEAWSWMATLRRKQRRYAEAVSAADAADVASRSFNLVNRLERELSATAIFRVPKSTRLLQSIGLCHGRMSPHVDIRTIHDLQHAELVRLLGMPLTSPVRSLEALLERFAGNRTQYVTTTDGSTLTAHRFPPDPRQFGARVQLVLWTRGPAAVRALYDEIARRFDEHPLFRIYHGEVELWLGEYEEAARILTAALARDPRTLWAWIGLGASLMFQGDLAAAQKVWKQGLEATHFAGPTLYVYRGECYRRQGEMSLASRDLEEAVRQKPQRLSARINLALLVQNRQALDEAVQRCAAVAPLLMEELSGTPAERLEKVLEAMRGNRSASIVSYHLWGRLWRGVTGSSPTTS